MQETGEKTAHSVGRTHVGLPPYSVLMSVYEKDRPEWVEAAIESMAAQTWPPEEILVVEDGPVPESLGNAIDACAVRHPGIIHRLPCAENKGLAEAMKYGVPRCSCEWIARMDADDYSDPHRCEEELRLAVAQNADIVGCDCAEFEGTIENVTALRVFPEDHASLVRFSRRKTPFCHPAVMMKKSAVLKAGNYQDVYLLEDYDLFVRMLAGGSKGCSLKQTLYYVRVSSDFYGRRGGIKYVKALLGFNAKLLREGWSSPVDFAVRSCGNLLLGLSPASLRRWLYRRLLRK